MSAQQIIQLLEKLVTLHVSLLEIAKRKTEIIKTGKIEQMQPLLVKERRHVQALEQVEGKRQELVERWFLQQNLSTENTTITAMLEQISNEDEAVELANVTEALARKMTELKQQEQLNQTLIQQSMKFINLSLDLINPSLKNMNYGSNKESESINQTVFDSKA